MSTDLFQSAMNMLNIPRMSKIKIDTRNLLPMEMLVAVQTLIWGMMGIWPETGLNALLERSNLVSDWGLMLLPYGAMQLFISSYVAVYGRDWPKETIFMSVSIRKIVSGFGTVAWVASGCALASAAGSKAIPFFIISLTLIVANSISFFFNWQIRTVLDGRIQTNDLAGRLARKV